MFSSTFVKGTLVSGFCAALVACGGGSIATGTMTTANASQTGSTGGGSTGTTSVGVGVGQGNGNASINVVAAVAKVKADVSGNPNFVSNPNFPALTQLLSTLSQLLQVPGVQAALQSNANAGAGVSAACQAAITAVQNDAQKLETDAQNDNDAAVQADAQQLEKDLQALITACIP